jgi:hypothetical protein
MADSLVSLAPRGVVFRARRIAGRGMAAAMIALAGTLAGCESPTEPPVELELDVAWQPGERIYSSELELIATVSGSSQAVVAHSVNGGPFVPASPLPDGSFRVLIDPVPMGSFTVTVKATHGTSEKIASRQYERRAATLTVVAPAGGTVYGRVVAVHGEMSQGLTIRTSLNGGLERDVQYFPPHPSSPDGLRTFWAEVHPLANGSNTVRVNAYDGAALANSTEFQVTAEVVEARYDAVVIDVDGSAGVAGSHLSNDGRVAGFWTAPGATTQNPFTWRAGVLTQLDQMREVRGLNNHGTILGAPLTSDLTVRRSVLWSDGVYTEIDGISGIDINDHGHILLGPEAGVAYWSGTEVVTYAEQSLSFPRNPRTINNSNLIGGFYYSGPALAILWSGVGSTIGAAPPRARNSAIEKVGDGGHALIRADLGNLSVPPPEFSGFRYYVYHLGAFEDLNSLVGFRVQGGDVNASGTVAGTYLVGDSRRIFTWRDGRTTDVVIDTGNWVVDSVTAIDDSGRILAHARNGAAGKLVTLLLVPKP